ncbi:MAG: hypothetical protein QM426_06475 [Euryarchaeota archaeon]|nr:hypothetical protein [Euryarchaeota archaeon]
MAVLRLLTIAIGILMLINPLAGAVILPWMYGIFPVAGGIAALPGGLKTSPVKIFHIRAKVFSKLKINSRLQHYISR